MTLKGPADADNYRVKVGRYGDRWYTDPLPADDIAPACEENWPSISTVKKASGSDWSFVALKRVAQNLEPLPNDYDGRYARLKDINTQGLKQAQRRGTGVHTIAEGKLRGFQDPMADVNSDAETYRAAVDSFFDTYQPELVACEFVAVHRDLNNVGYGGTGDAVSRIEGGNYVVDWKSRGADSEHGAYPEEAAQVAAYARSQYWIVDVDGPMRIIPPHLDGGLIVSIRPDGFRVYPVDLDSAFEHWTRMHAWWCARRSERTSIGRPWAPRKVAECPSSESSIDQPTRQSSTSSIESRRPSPEPSTTGSTIGTSSPSTTSLEESKPLSGANSERLQWLTARIRNLPLDARQTMSTLWPVGVPRGPKGPFTDEQLDRIATCLDKTEWQHNIIPPEEPGTVHRFRDLIAPILADPERVAAIEKEMQSIPIWTPPEEGPDVDLSDTKDRITALTAEYQVLFNRILKEAKDAKRSFHVLKNRGGMPSMRRALIVSALADVIEAADGDEELIRYAAGFALGEEVQPAVTLGCAVGSLTIQEAERLSLLAVALKAGRAQLLINEDGTASFNVEDAA